MVECDSAGVEMVLVSGVSTSELLPVKGLPESRVERLLVEFRACRDVDMLVGCILISVSRDLDGITTPLNDNDRGSEGFGCSRSSVDETIESS